MLLDQLGGSYSLCLVVAIYLVRRKLLALLRRWYLPSLEEAMYAGFSGRGLVLVGDVLAFSTEALYVDADDGGAMEGLLDIYLP